MDVVDNLSYVLVGGLLAFNDLDLSFVSINRAYNKSPLYVYSVSDLSGLGPVCGV